MLPRSVVSYAQATWFIISSTYSSFGPWGCPTLAFSSDGNFPPSNAPLRRLSLIGEQKERYVFTRSSANRPKATREVLPTGYKSFFRSLKVGRSMCRDH